MSEAPLGPDAETARATAITAFVATMAHELRGSLNTVYGFADLLYSEAYGPLNAEQRQAVTDILGASGRLRGIVTNVLDIARVEHGEAGLVPTLVSVRSAAELAASAAAERARDRLQHLTVDVDPRLAVWADEARVRQILGFLLDNALKYSDEGGVIQLTATAQDETVALQVTDQGCGIPLEAQPRIFDDFVSLDSGDRHERGAGLGLSLARRLAQAMDGELTVSSVPGSGATFALTLPRRDPPAL